MSAGRSAARGVAGSRDGERRSGGYAPRRAAGEGPVGERRSGGQRGERPGGRSYGDDSRRGGAWTRDERPARGVVAGSRRPGPAVEPPADIDPRELAHEVRSQLRTLSKVAADRVARHLVAAGRLVDEDPQAALEQARAARALGARVAVVREAVGETAYAAGEWAEALAELRTARRMTGDDSSLPMIADAERALGRPERALRIAQSPEVQGLAPAERAEMRIVEAGARRDLGQPDAALVTLQDFGLDQRSVQPWSARVWYAYADLLLAVGREDEARDWFLAAAAADPDGTTDADERLLELDGIEILTDDDDILTDDDEDHDIPEATPLPAERPAIDENRAVDEALAIDGALASEEAVKVDEVPVMDEAPALDEAPAIDEAGALDEALAVDTAVAVDQAPAVEQAPALDQADEAPAVDEMFGVGEVAAVAAVAAVGEVAAVDEVAAVAAVGEVPGIDEVSGIDEAPAVDEALAADGALGANEAAVVDRSPATDETPAIDEAVSVDEAIAADKAAVIDELPVFQEANVADVTGESSEVDEFAVGTAGADASGEAFVPEEAPVFKEAIAADEVADETASTTGAPTADVPVVFSDQEDRSGSSS